MNKLKLRSRCNKYSNEAERRMVDAIREMLGLDPLYFGNDKHVNTVGDRFIIDSHNESSPGYSSNGMRQTQIGRR